MSTRTVPVPHHRARLTVVAIDLALAVLGMLLLMGACALFASPAYGRGGPGAAWVAAGIAGPACTLPVAGLALLRGRHAASLMWHAAAWILPLAAAYGATVAGHGASAAWGVVLACAVPTVLAFLVVRGEDRAPEVSA